MDRFASAVGLVVLCLLGAGAWLLLSWRQAPVPPPPPQAQAGAPGQADDATVIKQALDSVREGGVATVSSGGKLTSVNWSMQDAKNVDSGVSLNNDIAAITVTLHDPEPELLTPAAYEKIKEGMTFPEVAEAIGGEMTKGRLSDDYNGTLAINQNKRRIDLTFQKGRVAKKSAHGIE